MNQRKHDTQEISWDDYYMNLGRYPQPTRPLSEIDQFAEEITQSLVPLSIIISLCIILTVVIVWTTT